ADYIETADDGALTPSGAEIAQLWDGEEGSAAGDAGFVADDVIVSVEGVAITTMEDLVVKLRLYHVGEEISVTVLRHGKSFTAALILDERPEDPDPIVDEETSGDG
ncbi:MAG: PDZ domain-containing protein, partial [Actinomycetota bacterium]|nr:PDZ domain-containing protein [Actinomycetota bacterium]